MCVGYTVVRPGRFVFIFSSRSRDARCLSDWSSDVCSSDLTRKGRYTGTCTYARLQTWKCGALKWNWRRDCASRDWTSRERTSGLKIRDWRLRLAGECRGGGNQMLGRVRCILYIGAVTGWIGLTQAQCQQPAGSKVASPQAPGAGQRNAAQQPVPSLYPSRSAQPVPAAQYSPLAAQGGYRGQKLTWYEALFRSLNPKNVDWGM